MLSYTLPHNYKRDILRPHWSAFFERLTEEQHNHQITIQRSEDNRNSTAASRLMLFRSIDYESFIDVDYMAITVAREHGSLSATYRYVVENPKRVEAFYEQGNHIFAVAVIDESGECTTVYFEDDAAMIYRKPLALRSPLLETAQPLEYALSFC